MNASGGKRTTRGLLETGPRRRFGPQADAIVPPDPGMTSECRGCVLGLLTSANLPPARDNASLDHAADLRKDCLQPVPYAHAQSWPVLNEHSESKFLGRRNKRTREATADRYSRPCPTPLIIESAIASHSLAILRNSSLSSGEELLAADARAFAANPRKRSTRCFGVSEKSSGTVDPLSRPQRARDVVQDVCVKLLPTEARALISADDLREEGWRQIVPVLV
jgi:hypothetical protein